MNQALGHNIFDRPQEQVVDMPIQEQEQEWRREFMATSELSQADLDPDLLYMCFSGTIESIQDLEAEFLQVKYGLEYGPDWELVSGQPTGVTQEASGHNHLDNKVVFNLPFELVFRTTSVQGWPQLVVQVFSHDLIGRSVVQAYGNRHLPLQAGTHCLSLPLFCPLPVSILSGFMGYLKGIKCQIIRPHKTLAQADGRELMRVKHSGVLSCNVTLRHLHLPKHGFLARPPP